MKISSFLRNTVINGEGITTNKMKKEIKTAIMIVKIINYNNGNNGKNINNSISKNKQ